MTDVILNREEGIRLPRTNGADIIAASVTEKVLIDSRPVFTGRFVFLPPIQGSEKLPSDK